MSAVPVSRGPADNSTQRAVGPSHPESLEHEALWVKPPHIVRLAGRVIPEALLSALKRQG